MSVFVTVSYCNHLIEVSFRRPLGSLGPHSSDHQASYMKQYVVTETVLEKQRSDPFIARTYGDVAIEALRRFVMDNPARREAFHLMGCIVIGLLCQNTHIVHYSNEMLPFKPAILFRPSIESRYSLLLSGPINKLGDAFLQSVFLQFAGKPADLNKLMRLSKRYKRLFSSDEVWNTVRFPANLWAMGKGFVGNENTIWDTFQHDNGLTTINTHRLRWHSHNFSRLKHFYGYLNNFGPTAHDIDVDDPVTMNKMDVVASKGTDYSIMRIFSKVLQQITAGCDGGDDTDATRSGDTIIILGLPHQHLAARILDLIHYIIPTSATRFHLSDDCKPLLRKGILVRVEPSPMNSRTRHGDRFGVDAGTLLESSQDRRLKYRRVGDKRLTFLQFDKPPMNVSDKEALVQHQLSVDGLCAAEDMLRNDWMTLSEHALGFIVTVEYNPLHELQLQHQIRQTLLNHCLYHCGSGYRRTEPLLIFVGVTAEDTIFEEVNDYIVEDAVQFVHRTVLSTLSSFNAEKTVLSREENIATKGSLFLDIDLITSYKTFPWYIQPIPMDTKDHIQSLKNGIFGGMNWLLRSITKQIQD